jgi:hypothetical protein
MSAAAVLSGTPAGVKPVLSGVVSIPAAGGAAGIAVSVPGLSASSVVVVSPIGAVDATAKTFFVDVVGTNTFTLFSNVNTTAIKRVNWAVVKL